MAKRITIAGTVITDLRIEPARADTPARIVANVADQDRDGATLRSHPMNFEVSTGLVPPAVQQAVETIVTFITATAEDG